MTNLTQSGFELIEDFITPHAEAELVHVLCGLLVLTYQTDGGEGRSRFCRLGWDYDDTSKPAPVIPDVIAAYGKEIQALLRCAPFDAVTVNEYLSGAGITLHTDSVKFGNHIAILSLNQSAMMQFETPDSDRAYVELLPRSLAVLKDDARYKWKHSIQPERRAKTRYTVVFRQKL